MREVHHVALLIGYGAAAVNPYLAMESVENLVRSGVITGVSADQAVRNLIKALGKGVLKVMSKMGISTVSSYTGAQVFEAVGLGQELIERYFTGTTSRLGGIDLDVVGRGGGPPARAGLPARRHPRPAPPARGGRGVSVAARGRAAPVRPRDGVPAPARHPGSVATTSSGSTPLASTSSPGG